MTSFSYRGRTRFRRVASVVRWTSRAGLLLGTLVAVAMVNAVPSETELKSALLFNLTQFVEWPSSSFADGEAPIVIGILGRDPFGGYLDRMVANEHAGQRRIVVERFGSVGSLGNCQVLFIDRSERENLRRILAAVGSRPILTVADFEDLLRLGGAVYFYRTTENKIRLRLNLTVTRAAALTISAKLLRVVDIVNEDED